MNQVVTLFLEKMKKDQDFAQKVLTCTTTEQVIKEAKAMGIDLKEEDIDRVNESFRSEILAQIDQSSNAGRLASKMLEDKDFAEQIMTQTEVEEAIKIAAKVGLSITEEDIHEVNKILGGGMAISQQNPSGELSEEDLETVAGGTFLSSIGELMITLMASVSVTVSTIVASTVVTVVTVVKALNPEE